MCVRSPARSLYARAPRGPFPVKIPLLSLPLLHVISLMKADEASGYVRKHATLVLVHEGRCKQTTYKPGKMVKPACWLQPSMQQNFIQPGIKKMEIGTFYSIVKRI